MHNKLCVPKSHFTTSLKHSLTCATQTIQRRKAKVCREKNKVLKFPHTNTRRNQTTLELYADFSWQVDETAFSKDGLSKLVKICFDNTTANDVNTVVLPELRGKYGKNGEGIVRSLQSNQETVRNPLSLLYSSSLPNSQRPE
jgi:hypothetical protein